MNSDIETRDCVDPDIICAHSFKEKCTATEYDHLCDEMKRIIDDNSLSYILGD